MNKIVDNYVHNLFITLFFPKKTFLPRTKKPSICRPDERFQSYKHSKNNANPHPEALSARLKQAIHEL